MVSRTLSTTRIAVLAGAAMLVLSSGPSSAFTLASPSFERPVAAANIEPVYCMTRAGPMGWHHGVAGAGPLAPLVLSRGYAGDRR